MSGRSKTCAACASPLAADELICASCGALAERDGASVRPCLRCEALVDADLQYCPRCGALTLAVEGSGLDAPTDPAPSKRLVLDEVLVGLVALLAAVATLGALVWVLLLD